MLVLQNMNKKFKDLVVDSSSKLGSPALNEEPHLARVGYEYDALPYTLTKLS